jgi:hypothetical protein
MEHAHLFQRLTCDVDRVNEGMIGRSHSCARRSIRATAPNGCCRDSSLQGPSHEPDCTSGTAPYVAGCDAIRGTRRFGQVAVDDAGATGRYIFLLFGNIYSFHTFTRNLSPRPISLLPREVVRAREALRVSAATRGTERALPVEDVYCFATGAGRNSCTWQRKQM